MKMQEVRAKSQDELKGMLQQFKKELFNLRFQKATGELENQSRFREVRRDIARVLTQLNALKAGKA